MIYTLEAAAEQEAPAALRERFRVLEEETPPRRLTYHDTFDWRLHRDGGTLALVRERRGSFLEWRSLDGTLRHRASAAEAPAFAGDAPEGPLGEALAPVTGVRRLLPVAEVALAGRLLRVLDDNDKTVVRVLLAEGRVTDPAAPGEPRPLPRRLLLLPVKGYDGELARVREVLEGELALAPETREELTFALSVLGRRPRDYSSRLDLPITSEVTAGEAVRVIHRHLLATMRANEEGARRGLDPEFLHDFRVAVRRTRSALGQVRGVLPAAAAQRFREELAWLGKVTGPTRDLDVYRLKLDDYRSALPERVRPHLEPLRVFLEEHQRREQRRLARTFGTGRYRELLAGWEAFLAREVPEGEEPPAAGRPVREVAAERIWRVWQRVGKRGSTLGPDSPARELHRLRIECKKLRYLLEIFRSLWAEEEIGPLVGALKKLQDNLGDFNDYEVQQGQLEEMADQMVLEDLAPVPTLLAMGRLLEELARGQEKERRRFARRFAAFTAKEKQTRFRRLFKPGEDGG